MPACQAKFLLSNFLGEGATLYPFPSAIDIVRPSAMEPKASAIEPKPSAIETPKGTTSDGWHKRTGARGKPLPFLSLAVGLLALSLLSVAAAIPLLSHSQAGRRERKVEEEEPPRRPIDFSLEEAAIGR